MLSLYSHMRGGSKRRIWLPASLLPLKVYAALAAIWLLILRSGLPARPENRWGTSSFVPGWEQAAHHFARAAHFVVLGYFVAAAVLVGAGVFQIFSGSRKGGCASIAFGLAALVTGLLLKPYELEHIFEL
jgi:hypothetical protein